jgi:hypothetical protein
MNTRAYFLAGLSFVATTAFAQTASTQCSFVGNQAICTTIPSDSAAISNLFNGPLELEQHPPQNTQLTNAINRAIAKYRESKSEDNSQPPANSQIPETSARADTATPSDSAVTLSRIVLTQDLKKAPDLATGYLDAATELHQLSDILNNPRLDQIATDFRDRAVELRKAQQDKANP